MWLGGILGALTHHDADLASWVSSTRDPPLLAVDEVPIGVLDDGGLNVGCITGGDCRFSHGETGPYLTIEQRNEVLLLLFWAGIHHQEFHVARIWRRAVEHFRRKETQTHQLTNEGILEVRQSLAVGGCGAE